MTLVCMTMSLNISSTEVAGLPEGQPLSEYNEGDNAPLPGLALAKLESLIP